MKKICIFVVLLFVVFMACKNSKKEVFEESEDYFDTIRKITIHAMPEDLLEDKSDSIRSFYKMFENHEIWVDRENREDLISQIEKTKNEGLNPEDYNINKIFQLELRKDSLQLEEQLAYDILLTQTYEKLCNHYYRGKFNPDEVYNNWDLFDKKLSVAKLLKESIDTKKIAPSIKGLLPTHPVYFSLKEALVEIDKLPNSKFDSIDKNLKIKFNDNLDVVKEIKKRLSYWKDLNPQDTLYTSKYDAKMLDAVKKFQSRHGLFADGVIGIGTIRALNCNKETRKGQILANLERWRWFSRNLGEKYILINLPDYELDYIVNKDTVAKHKIVCGRPQRMTPILSSKLSNFVFNPTWTVPPTIIKEDLSVEATANRNYFSRNRITIYKGTNTVVSPYEWNPEKAESYRYVQTPGYDNSLGVVKFNFPNHHSVYLHDTNHRDYFVYKYRALSSGCVRVQYPVVLAKMILEGQDNGRWKSIETIRKERAAKEAKLKQNKNYRPAKLTAEELEAKQKFLAEEKDEIDEIIAKKETYYIKVKQPIYIHQLYWTSWLDKKGLQFRDDIYNLDKTLYDKLGS
ncbi:murein L,D-transpeptidase [Flavobacterium terrigena]|uniref:Murein L,D-transpeptidase YcbB/YkuD n=2 Tax=Flavobacterium terrigena TaxID=402734 RepID=A0A1H6X7Z5_9FLAO|nr:Murein L,D-transpeptidase YcbB/YkuD [Flavobacterium terrigena]